MFDSPPAIKDYLCKQFSLHNIPIFGERDDKHLGDLVKIFRLFYIGNVRHSVNVSRYSSEKSTTSSMIMGRKWLEISVRFLSLTLREFRAKG